MDAISGEILGGYNPEWDGDYKKNPEWATKCVTEFRQYWTPYITDLENFRDNKDYLLGKNSIEKVKAQFKDEEFLKNTEWVNLGLMDSIFNTLTEEHVKNPPKPYLRSTDPSAIAMRQKDLGLLKNRGIIEGDLSKIQKGIGDPSKFKLDRDTYKSNIDEFDDWGLDESDPDDRLFFKDYHVLDCDIAGQALLNNVMSLNNYDSEVLKKQLIDILAGRKICMQVYVDKITGQIKYKYIFPDTAYGIFGDSFNGHDDTVRGWHDNISIGEWLQLAGNDFSFDRDWRKVLGAINATNNSKYTGFERRGVTYNCSGNSEWMKEIGLEFSTGSNIASWNGSQRFRVGCGYMEWKTWEATSTNLMRKDSDTFIDSVPYSYELKDKKEITEYYKESKFQQQWYGAYYLATGGTSQMIFNFSKVYYQQFYGANDEYSTGSLIFYRENGNPAMNMVKGDIDLITAAAYKMRFLIYKAKPEDEEYIWEELIEMAKIYKQAFPEAKGVGADGTIDGIIGQIISYMRGNSVKIRTFPKIEGKTIGQIPQLGGHRGIDPLTPAMQSIIQWGENRLAIKVLGNSMRLGMNPPSRESQQSEENTVAASQNSTGYIYRMIQYGKEMAATMTSLYAQDIIRFKDSLPYNFLLKLMGNERFATLENLEEYANHRYGKFFKDYNSEIAKAELKQAAYAALQSDQITYPQFLDVTQTDDFREGGRKLGLMIYKKNKQLRQQAVQDIQMQGQIEQQKHNNDMELETLRGKNMLQKEDMSGRALIAGKQIDAQSKMDVKDLTIQSEPSKIAYQTQGKQDVDTNKANLEASKAYAD